ncbi:MAG: DUF4340 domain-containing protein [Halioglobus sp.]
MSRSVSVLLLVLLIQCALVAVVFWPEQVPAGASELQSLAPFSDAEVDELRIGDEYDNEALLVRSGKQWLLPDLENLPADPARVENLLRGITATPGSWPIAHSPAARQRFQVADYYYQRRLVLLSGGKKLGTIYLGTSPGFRKVHARNADQDAVYSVTLNTFETPAINSHWLDPRLLQVRAPLRIDADLYNLRLEDGHWISATGGTPDEGELEALITALRTLQVQGVADEDLQRDLGDAEADLVLRVQSLAGEVTLQLVSQGDKHYIHSSEFPLFFKLGASDFERLTGIDARRIAGEQSNQ